MTPEELQAALRVRAITDAGIERAVGVLAGPDPAGILESPTREEVAHVAVYLHENRGRFWVAGWTWTLIQRGHPAASAMYWHEFQELEGYRLLRIRQPFRVPLGSRRYWQAHARASWEEARYWVAWAAAEGTEIPATAFLHAHPIRRQDPDEIPRVISELKGTWRLDIDQPSVIELSRAEAFYRDKQLTPQDVRRWLSS